MQYFKTKAKIIPGKSYKDVNKIARYIYHKIEKKSKRKAYIRSKYFKKQKIFLSFFWDHLKSKNIQDKTRRLKFFECAIKLLESSTYKPKIVTNPNNKREFFYRFYGQVSGKRFVAQVKRDKKDRLELMSVFPK